MSKISYRTLRENIVEEIRNKILNKELKPGMRIIEQDLSDELGASRGPIREALRQLEQEGMLEYTRYVGCSVRNITVDDIREINLLRGTYEILSVEAIQGEFTKEDIEKMHRILNLMKSNTEYEYRYIVSFDEALHQIIVEKSNMPRLMKAWKDLAYGNLLTCYVGDQNEEEVSNRQYRIHKDLVDACESGEVDRICNEIKKHYRLSIDRILGASQS